jgi:hypothetical protein
VEQFLNEIPPGSLVADVGCGNGKYMKCNENSFFIGSDRYLTKLLKKRNEELCLIIVHSEVSTSFQFVLRRDWNASLLITYNYHSETLLLYVGSILIEDSNE